MNKYIEFILYRACFVTIPSTLLTPFITRKLDHLTTHGFSWKVRVILTFTTFAGLGVYGEYLLFKRYVK